MARTAKATRATQMVTTKRPPGRPPGSKNKVKATAQPETMSARKTAPPKQKVTAPKRNAAVSRPPMVTKDELRTQVDKLERANATLRTKNREAGRVAKEAAARIETLEAQVANLERAAIRKDAPARTQATRNQEVAAEPKSKRAARGRKSGSSRTPEPMEAEAESELESPEAHSGEDKE
ncbi:hypothetical protein [Lichenicoccus roseus]|uniref:Uncharacterized protein n=1 Tax=Lichenicoccus roseus TaxID=2683649 RepID=A0A5R9J5J8_9PROT|nr:hypothetical protein [Lichenicoccus roseus]TLU70626.1 hypothetical protein FE263_20745 [Lichenicoccus roseus]